MVPAYCGVGRIEDAVRAAAASLRLNGETPERLALYGETLVYAADGVVTKEAQQAFTKALAGENVYQPKASLYLGLAAEQDGDRPRAHRPSPLGGAFGQGAALYALGQGIA